MRIESSIKGWFAVVAVSVSAVSCDMLDIMQDNKLSVSNMWKTAEQVEGSTYGIYSELRSNFVQSQINVFYWGELRVGEYMWGAKTIVSVTEANQNFSRVTRIAEKNGQAVIFKNNRPKYMLVDLDVSPMIDMTDDEKIDVVAARILKKYKPAFMELAK